jgi:type IV pilus assembly protein PilM
MFHCWANQPALLGVDIEPDWVRLIQLGQRQRQRKLHYCVEYCAIEPIKSQCNTQGQADPRATSQALQRALQKTGTQTRQVAIAIPSSAVISKVVTLPDVPSEQEMESQVLLEAEQHVPFSLAEIMLDFSVLGPSATALQQVDVLIVVTRRDVVEQRLALLQAAGLECRVVDVMSHVFQRAYHAFVCATVEPKARYALLALERDSFSLDIFADDAVVYSQTQNAFSSLEEALENAARTLFACSQTLGSLTQVGLAGPCGSRLARQLADQSGVSVALVNPFTNMTLRVGVPILTPETQAPSMLTACSLALRRFD